MSGLSLGNPLSNSTEWAINALKQIERWSRTQNAGGIEYNNASSGLDARNVQNAIDEITSALLLVQPLDADLTAIAANGLKGYLFGLTLSNNGSDATNDIDIATGVAADANGLLMALASGLTKRLDASWAVGTNQGGLDTGAIANTTYHVWLIQRSDTGVVDVLFSTSASAPTMPTSYDRKRRIGSIVRAGGAIKGFTQDGDRFRWKAASVQDVSATNPGTSAVTRTLTVPIGIVAWADLTVFIGPATSGTIACLVTALDETDRAASSTDFSHYVGQATTNQIGVPTLVKTNTSAQVRSRQSASGASDAFFINTFGWIDTRGRLA